MAQHLIAQLLAPHKDKNRAFPLQLSEKKRFASGILPPAGEGQPRVEFYVDQKMSCSRLPDQPAEVALGDIGQAGRASHVDRAEIVRGRKLEEASPGTWERLG